MIMKPSFEADKRCNLKDKLNAKKIANFEEFAGFHVVQPSQPYCKIDTHLFNNSSLSMFTKFNLFLACVMF